MREREREEIDAIENFLEGIFGIGCPDCQGDGGGYVRDSEGQEHWLRCGMCLGQGRILESGEPFPWVQARQR